MKIVMVHGMIDARWEEMVYRTSMSSIFVSLTKEEAPYAKSKPKKYMAKTTKITTYLIHFSMKFSSAVGKQDGFRYLAKKLLTSGIELNK
jgi:hypothetical protein